MLWVVHDTLGFSLLYSSYKGPGHCSQLFLFVPAFDQISVTCSLRDRKAARRTLPHFGSSYVTPLAPSVGLRFSYTDAAAASASLGQLSQREWWPSVKRKEQLLSLSSISY